ncbi:MAG: archease [Methanomassiliicoccales archaeon]|nr:archease [Methanomassiliicoccales archaeon]
MKYTIMNHTADTMIKAFGSSVEECFANVAYGMFDQIVDAEKIEPKIQYTFSIDGEDKESLLYNFLSELLYLFDAKRLLFSKFDIRIEGNNLTCTARGESFDPKKHSPKKEIKAVTYHMLKVDEVEHSATVLFDI